MNRISAGNSLSLLPDRIKKLLKGDEKMKAKVDEVYKLIEELRKELPKRMEAFDNYWKNSEEQSTLDAKTKQLINIA